MQIFLKSDYIAILDTGVVLSYGRATSIDDAIARAKEVFAYDYRVVYKTDVPADRTFTVTVARIPDDKAHATLDVRSGHHVRIGGRLLDIDVVAEVTFG